MNNKPKIKVEYKKKNNNPMNNTEVNTELDYSNKKIEELKKFCKEHKIKGYSNKNKDDIINLIKQHSSHNNSDINNESNNESNTIDSILNDNSQINDNSQNNDNDNDNKLKMIDLFAGTGAFTHAFELTNKVKCVYANDMNENSKTIYDVNFTHKLTLKDLNNIKACDIPNHDILTGGFPCQPFSIAGKQNGFKDTRSNVFWKIMEIVDHRKPKCIILENVKNLITHDNGKTFEIIIKNIKDRGYFIKHKILDTSKFTGIPQHRERIYIVCVKSKSVYDKFSLDFDLIDKAKISTMLESNDIKDKYYYNDKTSPWELLKTSVIKKDTIYQYRRVYVRENKNNECPTLTANMGMGGHNVPIILDNKGIRKLTPRECFNFQGFPSTFKLPTISDSHLYKLAGNAVSVPIVKLIANRLIPLLINDL